MKITELEDPSAPEIDVLIDLLHQQMIDIGSKKTKQGIQSSIQNALKPDSRARFFIAFEEELPVGMAFINVCSGIESEGDYVWLNELQVNASSRRQGFGTQIIQHIVEWSKANKCEHIICAASKLNQASRQLFQANGFSGSDMTLLERSLA